MHHNILNKTMIVLGTSCNENNHLHQNMVYYGHEYSIHTANKIKQLQHIVSHNLIDVIEVFLNAEGFPGPMPAQLTDTTITLYI